MTTSAGVAPAAWRPLEPRERRVLGVLVEKAKTTPAGYPMSVNAIVAGCNQKNNRDPLTAYDESDVEEALRQLIAWKAASELDWLGRVPKYKHHAYEWLGVSRAEAAVLTELLLRGAQPLGELRARAARMEPIGDLAALRPILEALLARGLVVELSPAGRGQIVTHNLYPPAELAELRARHAGGGTPLAESPAAPATAGAAGGLAAEIATLRAEIADLRERLARLETQLREPRG